MAKTNSDNDHFDYQDSCSPASDLERVHRISDPRLRLVSQRDWEAVMEFYGYALLTHEHAKGMAKEFVQQTWNKAWAQAILVTVDESTKSIFKIRSPFFLVWFPSAGVNSGTLLLFR